jgi:hypothetical protein
MYACLMIPYIGIVDVPLVESLENLNTVSVFIPPVEYIAGTPYTEEGAYYYVSIYQPYHIPKAFTLPSGVAYFGINNIRMKYGGVPKTDSSTTTEIRFPDNYVQEYVLNENNRVNVEYTIPLADKPLFDVYVKNMFAAYHSLLNTRYWDSQIISNPNFVGTSTWSEVGTGDGSEISLMDWIARWKDENETPSSVFRGRLYGQFDYHHSLQIPVISDKRLFLPLDAEYDIKACQIDLSAEELKGMLLPSNFTSQAETRPSLLRKEQREKKSVDLGIKNGGISPWQINEATGTIFPVGNNHSILMGSTRPTETEDGEYVDEYSTPNPTSMFTINGSQSSTVEVGELDSSGVLILDAYHYLVLVNGESGEYPIQFPPPNICLGRIYGIKVEGVDNRVYAYVEENSVGGEIEGADESSGELDFEKIGTYWFQSDGTDWKNIGGISDCNWSRTEDSDRSYLHPKNHEDWVRIGLAEDENPEDSDFEQAPLSTLDVEGSKGSSIVFATADSMGQVILTEFDHFVSVTGATEDVEVVLPDPEICKRRVYGIKALDVTNVVSGYIRGRGN